jgi:HlyD family secretion protein
MADKSSSHLLKWTIILVVAAAAIGGGIRYFVARNSSAVEYQTAPVSRGDLVQVVTATGQLNPVVNVQVGSQISGTIQRLYVDFNSTVKSNQIVAQLDPATYQANLEKAAGDLANSKAVLELAQVEANRSLALFTNNLISQSDYDTATANLHEAQANVQLKQADLDNAKVDLSRCTIYAPVDGVVISRNVDVGQTVAASFSTPTLFLIANDLSKMQIDALVSEADIGGVAVKQKVNFTVDAYPYRTFRGEVSQIRYGPITNQNVVSYDAVIGVNNDDLKLLPGMTANVSIIVAERQNALKIPNAALRFRPPEMVATESKTNSTPPTAETSGRAGFHPGGPGGGASGGGFRGAGGGPGASPGPGNGPGGAHGSGFRTVYVLNATDYPAHPELTPAQIRTGINDGASTEVIEGLKEGDQVVIGLLTSQSDATSRPANPFSGGRRF